MVKADLSSLTDLNSQLTKQLDQYNLRFNDIFTIQRTLEANWDEEKCGSFASAMEKVKGAKYDVESGIIEIRKLVAEMMKITEEYNKIKF